MFILIQCFTGVSLCSLHTISSGLDRIYHHGSKYGTEQSYLPHEDKMQKKQEGRVQNQDTAFKSMPQ